MIFTNKKWNLQLKLDIEKPVCLKFENTIDIYSFIQDYNEVIDEKNADISLYKDAILKLDTASDYITNLIGLDLNNRKSLNFLHKIWFFKLVGVF